MKNKLILVLVLSIAYSYISNAQLNFKKGYFVTNNGNRINCFIKKASKKQPKEIIYRKIGKSEDKVINVGNIKEYSILNEFILEKYDVEIDLSSNNLKEMNNNKEPKFVAKTIFLKLIVKGKQSLYVYEKGNLTKYFIKNDKDEITQLFFKRFKYKGIIKENITYRKQLWEALKCESIELKDLFNVQYNLNDLINVFDEYNKCIDKDFVVEKRESNNGEFNFSLRPGYSFINYTLTDFNVDNFNVNTNFNNKISAGEIRVGFEVEYIMPFFKNKWGILLEPTYRNFSTVSKEKIVNETSTNTDVVNMIIDYRTLEFPFSIRYNVFINNNSKLFLNAGLIFDVPLSSTLEFESNNPELEGFTIVTTDINYSLGVGYKYNDKLSIELRYQTDRTINIFSDRFELKYQATSLIFGYSIF